MRLSSGRNRPRTPDSPVPRLPLRSSVPPPSSPPSPEGPGTVTCYEQQRGGGVRRRGEAKQGNLESKGPRCPRGGHRGAHWDRSGLTCHQKRLFLRKRINNDTGSLPRRLGVRFGAIVSSHVTPAAQILTPKGAARSTEPLRRQPLPQQGLGERLKCKLMQRGEGVRWGRPVCCATEGRGEAGPRQGGGPCQGGPHQSTPSSAAFRNGGSRGLVWDSPMFPSRSDGP